MHNGTTHYPDLAGKTFGRITILAMHPERTPNRTCRWFVQCACGAKSVMTTPVAKRGTGGLCCRDDRRRALKEFTGRKIGHVTVLSRHSELTADRQNRWVCLCDCGKRCVLTQSTLVSKRLRKHCGCLPGRQADPESRTNKFKREDGIWRKMMLRCYDSKDTHWHRYGGRGIRVCKRWHTFDHFAADMAPRPPAVEGMPGKSGTYTLDRIDNDGPYSKANCRWATYRQQANNVAKNVYIEHLGRRQTIAQWSRELGMPNSVVRSRMERTNDPARLLHKGRLPRIAIAHDGQMLSPREWSEKLGLPIHNIYKRVQKGLPPAEVLRPIP